MMEFGCAPGRKRGRTPSTARLTRKIAIYGTNSASLVDAPWADDSWEHWGHASGRAWYKRELDRYFDLHPKACWSRGGKKTHLYPRWLAMNTVPIYMQRQDPEVPASVTYPKGRILAEFGEPRPYFANHVAWMVALALTEGVTTVGLWGIEYGIQSEYRTQRASCEYWIGRATERGVRVILPEQCTLLRQPKGLYGYESHDEKTGERLPEYVIGPDIRSEIVPIVPGSPGQPLADPLVALVAEIESEEMEFARPDWALRPLPPGKGNGSIPKEGSNV